MQSLIKLNNVWKIYRIGNSSVEALRGINITIKQGDFIAIMGPSGSGKSTSMNMVGCLDLPTRGKVYLGEHDISSLDESELAGIRGRKIGFIFQQFNLINTLSALENVMLPMIFQGTEEGSRMKRAIELLEMVELKDRMNHRPNELSGGEQQRVAIARALANDPDIVLADEPTGNLDSKTGSIVMDFLKTLNKKGKTVILVTHDPLIAKNTNKIYYIKDGEMGEKK
ncbi:MAG: ABC transporter ATP-binding protein [Nanoarchaeota archaeon]